MANPEAQQPFAGRSILVLGGSSGTGLEIVREAALLGARVAVGTRSHERFAAVLEKLSAMRLDPFVADLTVPDAVEGAVDRLCGDGFMPTDLVIASAGGMETFLRPVLGELLRIQRLAGASERSERLESLRLKVSEGVEASLPAARAINVEGPTLVLRLLEPQLRSGTKVIFLSSLWSSVFGTNATVPAFYGSTARTKQEFERHLIARTPELNARGIWTAILSGHLILDTDMGRAIERFIAPLLAESDHAAFSRQFIEKRDVVDAMMTLLAENPTGWQEQPEWRFVFGPGPQVTRRLPAGAPLFRIQFPI